MVPKTIIEGLIENFVYIYCKDVQKEFAGKLLSIKEVLGGDILLLEDKNNNIIYIPISEVIVITERR
ncbi:MAG: hypothetical protein ACFFE5_07700 [Candidatus Thorarchaeota archaeon]